MRRMKYRLPALILAVAFSLATPLATFASSSSSDEDQTPIDARLQGYQSGSAALNNASGSALLWLLLFVLMAICLGVLFMNPKRTHLD